MGWKSKAENAKRGHRPSLKNWSVGELYQTFPAYVRETICKPNNGYEVCIPFGKAKGVVYHTAIATAASDASGNGIGSIPVRIDAKFTSPTEFHQSLEAFLVPTVITNIPQGYDIPPPPPRSILMNMNTMEEKKDDYLKNNNHESLKGNGTSSCGDEKTIHAWKALERWDLETLANDLEIRERALKCGEDDDGKTIRMKLKHFMKYLHNNIDDSPLYIFDSSFDEDKMAKRLLSDYRVPTYFNEDLFHLVGERRRPPYRWFLIGPERSGTCVHIDPLATSAWNTLITGKKRWVLFPPHVPKSIVKGKGHVRKHEDDEAIHYFTVILPRIKRSAIESGGFGRYEGFECYEFTQNEGETVFIPSGWWHAVLNLTDTVGVTQNFCSQRNFDDVWLKTRTGRKKMAYKWLCKLDDQYPHLADRARELNKRDEFVLKYDPVEVEKRRKKEEERKRAKYQSKYMKKNEKSSSFNRDAKRSKVERVVSPDFS
mmetsp:Transcript_23864/g.27625  ORF Transcript_23864/g.27625 Transcript_23864/m.27625 type:complete len:485 (+) Transcript_23864:295-1749(+)